jgi:Flp pilus assembly protein TadD
VKAVDTDASQEYEQGLSLLRNDYPGKALVHLTKAVELEKNNPFYLSYLGVALARAGKNWSLAEQLSSQTSQTKHIQADFDLAEKLCSQALRMKRTQPELYLNLAEVYAVAGNKEDAIETLSRGLKFTKQNEHLADALQQFGSRRPPVLRFLDRTHFLNRSFGKMRNRLLISLGKAV